MSRKSSMWETDVQQLTLHPSVLRHSEPRPVVRMATDTALSSNISNVGSEKPSEANDGAAPVSAPITFPEGGMRAWTTVFGVWLMQFVTFGYTNAYGVFNDFYVREYLTHNTSSQISWIGSVQLGIVLSIGLFTGRAFDTGYFYFMMIGGSVLFIFCLFMLSLAKPEQYYQVCYLPIFVFFDLPNRVQIFLAQGIGLGIAIGSTYVPGLGVVSHYFSRRRALALGVAASGSRREANWKLPLNKSALGGVVHPIMLNKLIHGSVGFANGVRASAGMNTGLLVISLLCMRTRLPPVAKKASSILQDFNQFSRDAPYVISVLGTALVLSGLFFPVFFLQLSSIEHGVDPNIAFYTLAILNASSTIGRVLPNFFVPRYGVFVVLIVCTAGCAILNYCTIAVTRLGPIIVFAILYGFFSGAYTGVFTPMIASHARKQTEIGARLGICFTFTGIGGLIGTPIAGALLTSHFVWWRPIIFAGTTVTVGCICFIVSHILLMKAKNQK
ncbi:hypothetical protein D9619_007765 [Psilocybe cf. subviscida]|uniref:Major facilitator superfamily (MFS) profile domain-containing protein n=1 Tax=Psilocybe cf. subviscida TaxID=2480587 RepID=A0A8H5ATF8_9AGAR|nr:hypothetical protein D9619_007765 [Psilocybe cf. subviscida]